MDAFLVSTLPSGYMVTASILVEFVVLIMVLLDKYQLITKYIAAAVSYTNENMYAIMYTELLGTFD
jgi:hypothetical protein